MKRKIIKLTETREEINCEEAYCDACSQLKGEGPNDEDVPEFSCKLYGPIMRYNSYSKEPIRLQDCIADEAPND